MIPVLAQCSTHSTRFFELGSQLAKITAPVGLKLNAPSVHALASFESLPEEIQLAGLEDLELTVESLTEFIKGEGNVPIDLMNLPRSQEIRLIKQSLFRRKMYAVDDTVFDLVDDGDIMEVYSTKGIQIARSWNCFRFSGYSLIDLLSNDWKTLYIRPAHVEKNIDAAIAAAFTTLKTQAYNIPEYLLVERLVERDRALLFQMKFVSPIRSLVDDRVVAGIATGGVRTVAKVRAGKEVEFL